MVPAHAGVRFRITTHDAGHRLTAADFDLAARIDRIAAAHQAPAPPFLNGSVEPTHSAHLAVQHKAQESRTGDVNRSGEKCAPASDPRDVTANQTASMSMVPASAARELVAEYEAKVLPEEDVLHPGRGQAVELLAQDSLD